MCGAAGCRVCGIAKLTEEQKRYYDTRSKTRHRLDLRGKALHKIELGSPKQPFVLEIEEGLLKWWVDLQDQPDEIIVDSVQAVQEMLTGKRPTGPPWQSYIYWYRTKFAINPNIDLRIPIFGNV